ncbi:MAG: TlpA family protein disulfide reductase [Nitratireductor sp.]
MTDTKNRTKFLPFIRSFVAIVAIGVGVSACSDGSVDSEVAASSCSLAVENAKKMDDHIGGDMAAFSLADRPISLADVAFKDANDKPLSLADYSGKTLLVNLWATWCAPCRAEMPALEHLEKELGGESFAVLPISVDRGDSGKPKAFYSEIGLKALPFLHDAPGEAFKLFKKEGLALGLPATVLIDDNGCVLGKLNGPAEWGGPDAQNLIKTALAAK